MNRSLRMDSFFQPRVDFPRGLRLVREWSGVNTTGCSYSPIKPPT